MLEAKTNLSRLVAAATEGEVIIIANRGKPVVQLVPVEMVMRHTASEAAKWFEQNHVRGSGHRSSEDLDQQISEERASWE